MEWDRSETLHLAEQTCTFCHGVGLIIGRRGRCTPCNCVLRSVFRACLYRFRDCVAKEKYLSRVSLEVSLGNQRRNFWGRKDEEYIADFCLVSQRHLAPDELRIFRYHFLLGADWKLCCRQLKMERGTFFHMVYRIQQRLGRVFRELKPYSLYPLDEYFGAAARLAPEVIRIGASTFSVQDGRKARVLLPPVRKAA